MTGYPLKELLGTVLLSLAVSGAAALAGAAIGVPLGTVLGLKYFPRSRWITNVVYTLMGMPPILAGLVVYVLLSREGPLGGLGLVFTPPAMVVAQTVLAAPIVAGLTMVAVREKRERIRETAVSLGASPPQVVITVMAESRVAIVAAVIAGFGRAIAEVGAVMLVGGNIRGKTRVMTTAILLEARQGNIRTAMILGLILLAVSFAVNSLLHRLQWEARR